MSYRREHAFVGVDTHKAEHVAAMTDCWHDLLALLAVPNDPAAFPGFLQAVLRRCPDGLTPVFGLEGTGGLGRSLAAFLLQAGYVVKEINPVHTDRERSHSPHPDKSDPKDARAVAKVLVDKFHELPAPRIDDHAEAMAHLVQHRESMVRALTQLKNRLHALLPLQYPCYKTLFKDTFSKAALAFWSRFPSPHHLQGFGPNRLGAYLRKHSNNTVSTKRATEILSLVQRETPVTQPAAMRNHIIRDLVAQIRLLDEQVDQVEEQLAVLLKDDGDYLTSMVGIDVVTAARIIAEIGDINRFSSADKLARFAGAAPLENSSGGRKNRKQSTHGRRKLNWALYTIALTQIGVDRHGSPRVPLAYQYYQRKIAEGKTKKAALRCLMRRLCDVIYAMMKRRQAYDPARVKAQAA